MILTPRPSLALFRRASVLGFQSSGFQFHPSYTNDKLLYIIRLKYKKNRHSKNIQNLIILATIVFAAPTLHSFSTPSSSSSSACISWWPLAQISSFASSLLAKQPKLAPIATGDTLFAHMQLTLWAAQGSCNLCLSSHIF